MANTDTYTINCTSRESTISWGVRRSEIYIAASSIEMRAEWCAKEEMWGDAARYADLAAKFWRMVDDIDSVARCEQLAEEYKETSLDVEAF